MKMKGVSLVEAKKFEVIEKEQPEVKENYVKVKVHKAGICGSDVNLFWSIGERAGTDFLEGHEFSGEVVDPNGSDFKKGDRVVIIDLSPCYECEYCKSGREQLCDSVFNEVNGISIDGGFGEYVIVRKDLLRKIPDNMSYTKAAMIEPMAISYHACKEAGVKEGDNVLVTGGGPIGLFAALSAEVLGAKSVTITEVNDDRLEILRDSFFIDHAINGLDENLDEKLNEISPDGFDVVLECTGNKYAATTGFNHVKKGGKLIIIAIHDLPELNVTKLIHEEITVKGVVMFTIEEFEEVIKIFSDDNLDIEKYAQLIQMEDVQDTVEKMVEGKANKMKYIIDVARD